MSFLVGEDDAMSTLEEVVAFINTWDTGSISSSDVTTSESENDNSPFSNEDVDSIMLDSLDGVLDDASFLLNKELQPRKPTKKKRKKTPGASTRLQRRKRAEILALRAESEQLEIQLEHLKSSQVGPMSLVQSGYSNTPKSSWAAIVAAQFQERFKSEVINQRLRAVLVEQTKLNKVLREAFQIQASLGNLHTTPDARRPLTDNSLAVIGELEKMVEGLYLGSAAVFQPKRGVLTTNSALRVTRDKSRGRVFEISASSALPCSVLEASAMFWRDYLTIRQYNDKSYHFVRQRKPCSVEKNFTWILRSDTSMREVNGFSFVRKIEEPNRVVLVEANRFLLPTEGLQFRSQRWTIITPLENGQSPSSLVRILIQLHAEYTKDFKAKKEDLQAAEDLVLGVLSTRMQKYLHRQQGEFAQEAEQLLVMRH